METYLEEYPDNNPPAGTRNETLLNLTDPAWEDHFWYDQCIDPVTNATYDYLNATTGTPNCNKPTDSADFAWYGDAMTGLVYEKVLECTCDACVQVETMQFLSPVGWIFTVTLTYSGFVLLAIGALWNANIVKKIKKLKEKCRELKAQKSEIDEKKPTEAAEIGSSEFDDMNFDLPKENEDCED